MKKVLFICNINSPYGGNLISSLQYLEKYINKDYKCTYLFPIQAKNREWIKEFAYSGENVDFFDFQRNRAKAIYDLCNYIRKNKYDIVHSHMLSYIYIYICSIITTKTRFIIHIHSDWSLGKDVSLKEKIRNYIKYKIICGKTRFITVSPKFVQYNPKRIIYIPNCIVLDRINDSLETRNEFRRNNNISDDEILCEVFGWSPLIKGVDIAANAIKYLIDNNHKNIKLLIICGEKYNNDQLSQWLKNNSNCNGNENYILYKAPRTDVFTFHNSSDILISASRSEGFSYVLLEMLSLGKNCIVSNIEGTKWSSDFNNVIMFKSEDYKDCAQAILKSIDRGIHSDLEDVERTKNTYNISIWAEKIKKYYDNL